LPTIPTPAAPAARLHHAAPSDLQADLPVGALSGASDVPAEVPSDAQSDVPVVSFAELGVPQELIAALRRDGVHEPFAIQLATLRDTLAGRDLCGKAPTGSGKTLAFSIPLAALTEKARPHRPTALVLCPTRELATQIQRTLAPLAAARGLRSVAVYGGASPRPQIEALRRGASIVVATPGRLADLIDQRACVLSDVRLVVLDEADRMADMGFMPQVKRLLDGVPADRQTLLFSATLDGEVDNLVRRYQRNPAIHEVTPPVGEVDKATHRFIAVDKIAKVGKAALLLREHGQGIVFCRTRHGADRVAKQLATAGVTTVVVHGSRSQSQRESALHAFTKGSAQVLVATDVAARGIHVDDVAVVVHWDLPEDAKDYVHRSGRTARAGASGQVVSLIMPEDRDKLRGLRKALGMTQPLELADGSFEEAPAAVPAGAARGQGRGGPAAYPRRGDRPGAPRRTGRRRPA
jgi:superfamily II DNA/RNA helicase